MGARLGAFDNYYLVVLAVTDLVFFLELEVAVTPGGPAPGIITGKGYPGIITRLGIIPPPGNIMGKGGGPPVAAFRFIVDDDDPFFFFCPFPGGGLSSPKQKKISQEREMLLI